MINGPHALLRPWNNTLQSNAKTVMYSIEIEEAKISFYVDDEDLAFLWTKSEIGINKILQASSSLHQKDAKPNLEVGAFVDIKILWCIHNRLIVHDKIFVIKLIPNWWRGRSSNEIKPRGNIKWRKPYGNVRRKDLYGKFLLNERPN